MKVKYILIWGTPSAEAEDFNKAMEEWEKTVKSMNCELLYWGASIGTQESIVICLKGSVTDFERLYGPGTMPPITGNRTNFVAEWVVKD
jgi:hypothetical protein